MSSFYQQAVKYSFCRYSTMAVQSSILKHIGCLQNLAIVNSVTMNIGDHLFSCIVIFFIHRTVWLIYMGLKFWITVLFNSSLKYCGYKYVRIWVSFIKCAPLLHQSKFPVTNTTYFAPPPFPACLRDKNSITLSLSLSWNLLI